MSDRAPQAPQLQEWLAQGLRAQRQGQLDAAVRRYEQVLATMPEQPQALHLLGLARFQQGRLPDAEQLLRQAVRQAPDNANAWSDLGMVHVRSERSEAALDLLDRALALRPDHPDALNNKAQALRRLGRHDQALPLLERLTLQQPQAPAAAYFLADTQFQVGEVNAALETYQQAVREAPGDRRLRLGLGEVLESLGQFDQARFQYLALLRRQPDNAMALARLLQMRDQAPEPEWVARAETLADDPRIPEAGRVHLNIALGYWNDRNDAPQEAFRRLQKGYGELAQRQPFSSDGYSRAVDALIETLTADFFERAPRSGLTSSRPIFIVGMPRSGTTLTEQILASHSQVAAGGELSMLLQVSHEIRRLSPSGQSYPGGLLDLGSNDLEALGLRYLRHLDGIAADTEHVTDKLPFNFMHLGLIALLFPNARVVHCRRHPLDNCLSCYFTSFADRIRFANRLDTLGRYYRDYDRLMAHWHQVLPIEIMDLQYEALVGDTEAQVAALLQHCGLPWEDACLAFHRTERAVRTPSRWQVRQPIYRGSVGRWRRYADELKPLRELLAPLLPEADRSG